MSVVDVLGSAALLAGALFVLLAAVGLQRFDDVFARMHASTKAVTLGLLLITGGAALRLGGAGDAAKLLLVAALQLLTAPVSAHLLGRGAYRSGTELSAGTMVDELADRDRRPPAHGHATDG